MGCLMLSFISSPQSCKKLINDHCWYKIEINMMSLSWCKQKVALISNKKAILYNDEEMNLYIRTYMYNFGSSYLIQIISEKYH